MVALENNDFPKDPILTNLSAKNYGIADKFNEVGVP